MNPFTVHPNLQRSYDGYYEDGAQEEWRRLSAVDKSRNIIELCDSQPHDVVLEIGAGDGAVTRRLLELEFAKSVSALDISDSAVAAMQGRGIAALSASKFDGYSIPHEEDSFDLVVMTHLIEHLEYPRRLIYEAARVGRAVFIEVPLEHTARMSRDYRPSRLGHINFYTDKSIRRLVQSCGLDVVRQRVTNPGVAVFRHRLGHQGIPVWAAREGALRLVPLVAKAIFTYHCSLLCRPQMV